MKNELEKTNETNSLFWEIPKLEGRYIPYLSFEKINKYTFLKLKNFKGSK